VGERYVVGDALEGPISGNGIELRVASQTPGKEAFGRGIEAEGREHLNDLIDARGFADQDASKRPCPPGQGPITRDQHSILGLAQA
jgi:hypothetical protein